MNFNNNINNINRINTNNNNTYNPNNNNSYNPNNNNSYNPNNNNSYNPNNNNSYNPNNNNSYIQNNNNNNDPQHSFNISRALNYVINNANNNSLRNPTNNNSALNLNRSNIIVNPNNNITQNSFTPSSTLNCVINNPNNNSFRNPTNNISALNPNINTIIVNPNNNIAQKTFTPGSALNYVINNANNNSLRNPTNNNSALNPNINTIIVNPNNNIPQKSFTPGSALNYVVNNPNNSYTVYNPNNGNITPKPIHVDVLKNTKNNTSNTSINPNPIYSNITPKPTYENIFKCTNNNNITSNQNKNSHTQNLLNVSRALDSVVNNSKNNNVFYSPVDPTECLDNAYLRQFEESTPSFIQPSASEQTTRNITPEHFNKLIFQPSFVNAELPLQEVNKLKLAIQFGHYLVHFNNTIRECLKKVSNQQNENPELTKLIDKILEFSFVKRIDKDPIYEIEKLMLYIRSLKVFSNENNDYYREFSTHIKFLAINIINIIDFFELLPVTEQKNQLISMRISSESYLIIFSEFAENYRKSNNITSVVELKTISQAMNIDHKVIPYDSDDVVRVTLDVIKDFFISPEIHKGAAQLKDSIILELIKYSDENNISIKTSKNFLIFLKTLLNKTIAEKDNINTHMLKIKIETFYQWIHISCLKVGSKNSSPKDLEEQSVCSVILKFVRILKKTHQEKIEFLNLLSTSLTNNAKLIIPKQTNTELKKKFLFALSEGHVESAALLEDLLKAPECLNEIDLSTGTHLVGEVIRLNSSKVTLQDKVKILIKIIEKWDAFRSGKSSYLHLLEYPNVHDESLLSYISPEILIELGNQNQLIKEGVVDLTTAFALDKFIDMLNKKLIPDSNTIQSILDYLLNNYIEISSKQINNISIENQNNYNILSYLHSYIKTKFDASINAGDKIDLFLSIYSFVHCCNSPTNEEWSKLRRSFLRIDRLFCLIKRQLGKKEFCKKIIDFDLSKFFIGFIKLLETKTKNQNKLTINFDLINKLAAESTLNNIKVFLYNEKRVSIDLSRQFRENIDCLLRKNNLKKCEDSNEVDKNLFEYYSESINWKGLAKSLSVLFNSDDAKNIFSIPRSSSLCKIVEEIKNIKVKNDPTQQNLYQFSLLIILKRLMDANILENFDRMNVDHPFKDDRSSTMSKTITSQSDSQQPIPSQVTAIQHPIPTQTTPIPQPIPLQATAPQQVSSSPHHPLAIANLVYKIHAFWQNKGVVDRLNFLLKLAEGKCQFDLSRLENENGYDIQFLKTILTPFYELFKTESSDSNSIRQTISYALKISRYCVNNNVSALTIFKENLVRIYPKDPNFIQFISEALSANAITSSLTPLQSNTMDKNVIEGINKAFIYFTVSDLKFHAENWKQIQEGIALNEKSVKETVKSGAYFFCKEDGQVIIVPLVFSITSGSKIQAVGKDNGEIRKTIMHAMQLVGNKEPLILPKNKIDAFNEFCIREKKSFISFTEISNSSFENSLKPIQAPLALSPQKNNHLMKESVKTKRKYQAEDIFSDLVHHDQNLKSKKTVEKTKHIAEKLKVVSQKNPPSATKTPSSIAFQSFKGFGTHSLSTLKSAGKGSVTPMEIEELDNDNELEKNEEEEESLESSNKKLKQVQPFKYVNQADQSISKQVSKNKTSPEKILDQSIVILPPNNLNEINLGEGANFYESLLLKTQAYGLNKLRGYSHYLKFNNPETLFNKTHSLTKVLHHCTTHQTTPFVMFDSKLKPYQKETVEKSIGLFLQKLGLVIASEPGLGKTRQAIEIMLHLQRIDKNGNPILIVVPKAILKQWLNEIQKRCFKSRRKYYKRLLLDSRGLNESQKNEFAQKFVHFFIQHIIMDDPTGNIKKRTAHLQKLFVMALRSNDFSTLIIKALIDVQNKITFVTEEKKSTALMGISAGLMEFLKGCENKFAQTQVLQHQNFQSLKHVIQNYQLTLGDFTEALAELILNPAINAPAHIKSLTTYIENLKPQYSQSHHSKVPPAWIPSLIQPDMYGQVIVISREDPINEADLKEKLKANQWTFVVTNKDSVATKNPDEQAVKNANDNCNALNSSNKKQSHINTAEVYNILRSTPFSLVIWDEAQEVTRSYNSLDAKKQKANAALAFLSHINKKYGTKLLALSGTPMPNTYNQTLSLIELVNPGSNIANMVKLLNEKDQTARKHLFELMKAPTRPVGETINSLLQAYLTYEHFKFIQKQLVLVHAKDDPTIIQQWTDTVVGQKPVCYIPTVHRHELKYEMDEVQKKQITTDLPKMKKSPIQFKAPFEVQLFHSELLKEGNILPEDEIKEKINSICQNVDELDAFIGRSALLNRFLNGDEFANVINEKTPCLIFLNYVQPAEALKKIIVKKFQLQAGEVNCYHGSMEPRERERVKNQFEKEGGILILTGKAGGVGLNLKKAKALFNLAPWWNDAYETQLEARAVRAGVSGVVNVYKFNGHSDAENYYSSIQERKKAWAQWILMKDDYKSFIKLLIDDLAAGFIDDSQKPQDAILESQVDTILNIVMEASQTSLNSEEFKKLLSLFRSFYSFDAEKNKKFYPENEFLVFPLMTFNEGARQGGREKAFRLGVNFMQEWKNESVRKSLQKLQSQIGACEPSVRDMMRAGDWDGLEKNKFTKEEILLLSKTRDSDDQAESITQYTHELYAFTAERKYQLLKSRVGGDQRVRILKRVFPKNCIKYDLLLER